MPWRWRTSELAPPAQGRDEGPSGTDVSNMHQASGLGEQVLPVYVVFTLAHSKVLNSLGEWVRSADSPIDLGLPDVLLGTIRIGALLVSDEAEEVAPLAPSGRIRIDDRLESEVHPPERPTTADFGAAWTLLSTIIPRDVTSLKIMGYTVFRPLVLFVVGAPLRTSSDEAYDGLVNNPMARPNIVALGTEDDINTLQRIGTLASFVVNGETRLDVIMRDLIASYLRQLRTARLSARFGLETPDGCTAVPLDLG
jgi:hypothetical protein